MTETEREKFSNHESILEVHHLYKSFGETEVLHDLSFSVGQGEFLTILGASGCGKTTLLRILCGLEHADSGQVLLSGSDITNTAPEKRPVNTVFQSYALFPHMTVSDNIAYPLRLRRIPKKERTERVSAMLALVQMTGYEKRYPAQLSGGQKQRIAIARALIGEPQVLLLDEPLGALDFHLRRRMQTELKRMQQALGITFIYITHDQEEALNLSDRIAVMHNGHFLQLDTPAHVYDSPADTYAARFVGEANLLPASFIRYNTKPDTVLVSVAGQPLSVRRGAFPDQAYHALQNGDRVTLSVRGETLRIKGSTAQTSDSEILLSGTVTEVSFAAGVQHVTFSYDNQPDLCLTAVQYGMQSALMPGDKLVCTLSADSAALCMEEADMP